MAKPDFASLMALGKGLSGVSYPPVCGDFAIKIDKNGQWYYQNSPIGRLKLAQLFAVCLIREANDYFLATPFEKGKIIVEDTPFIGVEADISDEKILIRTNLDFWVEITAEQPFILLNNHDEPKPLVRVRDNLWLRCNRNVFYDLVAHAKGENGEYFIYSNGQKFFCGREDCPDDNYQKTIKKITFRAQHRGTKEIDLMMNQVFIAHLSAMSLAELQLLSEFLKRDEQEIYDILVAQIPTSEFQALQMRALI